jgi:mannose-6-phosphate isomerase-like protein (cupin superfamily)
MVTRRERAEHYVWGDGCDGWRLLDRADLSVIEERVPPGASEVRHVHDSARQLFYVLAGQLTIDRGGDTLTLASGDALEVPPTVPHLVRNDGAVDAVFLVISAPTTRGDRTNLV